MFLTHGTFWGKTAKARDREAGQLRPVDGGKWFCVRWDCSQYGVKVEVLATPQLIDMILSLGCFSMDGSRTCVLPFFWAVSLQRYCQYALFHVIHQVPLIPMPHEPIYPLNEPYVSVTPNGSPLPSKLSLSPILPSFSHSVFDLSLLRINYFAALSQHHSLMWDVFLHAANEYVILLLLDE